MHPAKAVGRNKMAFGRDNHVIQSNIILVRGPGLLMEAGKGEICGMPPIANYFGPCYF